MFDNLYIVIKRVFDSLYIVIGGCLRRKALRVVVLELRLERHDADLRVRDLPREQHGHARGEVADQDVPALVFVDELEGPLVPGPASCSTCSFWCTSTG